MGGLSQKATILDKLRIDTKGRDIVVDAGNSLFAKNGRFKPESAEQINARAVAEVYLLLGFDALAVGGGDLSAGLELLRETADQGLPWISANLYDSNDKPVFAPFIVKEIDNLSVAIVGITGPEPMQSGDFVIKDGASVLACGAARRIRDAILRQSNDGAEDRLPQPRHRFDEVHDPPRLSLQSLDNPVIRGDTACLVCRAQVPARFLSRFSYH